MDKKILERYKKIYLEEKVSDPALQKGLDNLMRMLPEQDSPVHNTFFRYRFLFAGIILLMLVGTAGLAQAANSGELLYPVKILTNNVAAKIFGRPEINSKKVENNIISPTIITPKPTEKENEEDQKDLQQKGDENKEQDETEKNKPEEDARKQENEVKGVSSEVGEIKKPESEERGQSDKNKSNELSNGDSNKEKNKKDNQRKED